jgi:hypothetical protein
MKNLAAFFQGVAAQDLPRFGVFNRRRVQRNSELFHHIERAPVGQPIFAG